MKEINGMTIQAKAIEQCFPVYCLSCCTSLIKVVLIFDFVDENLKCDHSDESY